MEILRIVLVALGIGLVIFVHELGHFIAARLCGVRVDVFSLGFGPKLLGWQRGATLYQIAAVPLGGYVKMLGEEPDEGQRQAGDDLRSKSVGQRFFIYSGGVLMNVVFGLVVFPLILSIGVPFSEPLIGRAIPGGPAWHARIEAGTRVLAVDGQEVISFMALANEVALGDRAGLTLELLDPGQVTPREVRLVPRFLEQPGVLSIDVTQASDPQRRIEVAPDSPAARAGLQSGDRIAEVQNSLPGQDWLDGLAIAMDRGEPLELVVEREGQAVPVRIEPGKAPESEFLFGLRAPLQHVRDLRENPDRSALGLLRADRLISAQGQPIRRTGDLERALLPSEEPTVLVVQREGRSVTLRGPPLGLERRRALIADMALEQDLETTEVALTAGGGAERAGVRDGDRVLRLDGIEVRDWESLRSVTREAAAEKRSLRFEIERTDAEGAPRLVELDVAPASWSQPFYGLALRDANYVYRAPSFVDAVRIGISSSWKFVVDAWRTLSHIAKGDVSGENIGGIIMISSVSYSFSSEGLAKLFFFLCILSLNLAFINVLPIPLLDGGHLLFLLIEKLKGSPVSARVQGYSQMVGLVLIVSLMVYVTYNDLSRVLLGQ